MHNTTQQWKDLYNAGSPCEIRVEINGVAYTQADIVSCRVYGSTFTEPSVGNTCSRQIELKIRPKGETIPKAARIVPFIRFNTYSGTTSEWIQKGVFFIDKRSTDDDTGVLTIRGYDAMMRAQLPFKLATVDLWKTGSGISIDDYAWDVPSVVNAIAGEIGVTVDPRTNLEASMYVKPFMPDGPYSYDEATATPAVTIPYTCRQMLGYIAAMHGANWIITDAGELWLCPVVPSGYVSYEVIGTENDEAISIGGVLICTTALTGAIGETGDSVSIARSMQSFDLGDPLEPWSAVRVKRYGEVFGEAGETEYDRIKILIEGGTPQGRDLNIELPFQDTSVESGIYIMACYVAAIALGRVRGAVYCPFEARNAFIDPAAELGDMISVNGVQSVLASIDWAIATADCLYKANISAPGEQNGEMDIKYEPETTISTKRYVDSTISSRVQDAGLKIRIVSELPEDHAAQNVLWVIPDG